MEEILKTLGSKTPFKQNGELSYGGEMAYEKLMIIIRELYHMGVIKEDPKELQREFDDIINSNF